MANLFENVPDNLPAEHFTDLVKDENVRIERIVSLGHTSPESGWYMAGTSLTRGYLRVRPVYFLIMITQKLWPI